MMNALDLALPPETDSSEKVQINNRQPYVFRNRVYNSSCPLYYAVVYGYISNNFFVLIQISLQ